MSEMDGVLADAMSELRSMERVPVQDLAGAIERLDPEMGRALLAVPGREGAVPRLSGPQSEFLAAQGVLGRSGGLTSRGVALRAILDEREMDRLFG